jgi:hypothetical protein
MRRMPFLYLSVFSLLGISLAAGGQALATAAPSLAGRIAIEGQLTGSPSLGGVRLALYAMPPQPFMNKLRVGDRVQGQLVGVATSSATGAYAIRVSHPDAVTSSAFNGIVNFEVWGAGQGYATLFGFSRKIAAGNALVPLFGQATTAPVRASLSMHRLSKPDASVSPSPAGSGCWLLSQDLGPKWATLEGLWSTIASVHKSLTYSDGATSSVSIGISVTDGKWTTANTGTTSVTNTGGSQDFPEVTGKTSRLGQTEMEEGLFLTCQISDEAGTFPYAVDGGTRYVQSIPPKATKCVHELKGSTIHMTRTQSYTFSSGIDLQATFGISLSTLTGYTTEAAVAYRYTASGYACGTKNYPLRTDDTAHGLVADAKVSGNR